MGGNYKIRISKDYKVYNVFKDGVYLASYKLLKNVQKKHGKSF